jgi:flagellar protein FliL
MATKPVSKSSGGGKDFILGMLVATAVAAGGGAFFGVQLASLAPKGAAEHEAAAEAQSGHGHDSGGKKPKLELEGGVKVIPLPPILSNVAVPADVWVRIEAQAIFEGKDEEAKVLIPKVAEDLLAFMKTVTLAQIEGPSGFQHLREDLDDRARVRSEGKIRELVIESFIIE